jgi:pilus assembly protein CpaE
MKARSRYLLATSPGLDTDLLTERLAERGELVAFAESGGEAVAMGESSHPDVAVIDMSLPGLSGLEACRELHDALPRISVVMMSKHPGLAELRDCMYAGAEGFLVHPVSIDDLEDELDRVEEIRNRRPETPPRRSPAQGVWSFLSAKSGEGRTTTILALADQLQKLGRKVVVVDFDLQFGDVGFLLGLKEGEPDVFDAVPEDGKVLAGEELMNQLRLHSSGLPVLTAPTQPRNLRSPSKPEDLGQLVENLAELFDHVLVDFPVGLPSHLIPVLDRSRLVFVSTRNLPSVIESNLVLKEILRSLGYGPTKLRVLVLGEQESGDPEAMHRKLEGIAGVLSVPAVPEDVETALRSGKPLFHDDQSSPGARGFRRLALRLIGPGSVVQPLKGRKSLQQHMEDANH